MHIQVFMLDQHSLSIYKASFFSKTSESLPVNLHPSRDLIGIMKSLMANGRVSSRSWDLGDRK